MVEQGLKLITTLEIQVLAGKPIGSIPVRTHKLFNFLLQLLSAFVLYLVFIDNLHDGFEALFDSLLGTSLTHHDGRMDALLENPDILVILKKEGVSQFSKDGREKIGTVCGVEVLDVLSELGLLLAGLFEVVEDEFVHVIYRKQ